ncbi:unnamed protein product, partial [Allacma fusca]
MSRLNKTQFQQEVRTELTKVLQIYPPDTQHTRDLYNEYRSWGGVDIASTTSVTLWYHYNNVGYEDELQLSVMRSACCIMVARMKPNRFSDID